MAITVQSALTASWSRRVILTALAAAVVLGAYVAVHARNDDSTTPGSIDSPPADGPTSAAVEWPMAADLVAPVPAGVIAAAVVPQVDWPAGADVGGLGLGPAPSSVVIDGWPAEADMGVLGVGGVGTAPSTVQVPGGVRRDGVTRTSGDATR